MCAHVCACARENKSILSHFWRPESEIKVSAGLVPSAGSEGGSFQPLQLLMAASDCWGSLAYGHITTVSACVSTSPFPCVGVSRTQCVSLGLGPPR